MSYYEQWQMERFGNMITDQSGDGFRPVETKDLDIEDQIRKVEEKAELELMVNQ